MTFTRVDKLSFAVLQQSARTRDGSGAVSRAMGGAERGAGRGAGRGRAQSRLTDASGSDAAAQPDTT